jgi:glutathione synthase/RimK-type ligase-like ATP-grasp enzyme
MSLTFLCVSSYEKGYDFMRECKDNSHRVILLTCESLKDGDWPNEAIDDTFYIPDKNKDWEIKDAVYGVSFIARSEKIDRIVALDDFDVEKAASLREHLRVPGMGDTTARYFRDKLAMRMQAKSKGIPVPDFLHVLNYDAIHDFTERVPFPYMVKPRLTAGAHGLKKVSNKDAPWNKINELHLSRRYNCLPERNPVCPCK